MTVPAFWYRWMPVSLPWIKAVLAPLAPLVTRPPDAKSMPTPLLPMLSTVPRLVSVQAKPLLPKIPATPESVELTSMIPVEVTVAGLSVAGKVRYCVVVKGVTNGLRHPGLPQTKAHPPHIPIAGGFVLSAASL